MAGNDIPNEIPGGSGPSGKPRVKTFACANCGASVSIRNPGRSLTVVCQSCHSVIDATNENYAIISKFNQSLRFQSDFILGTIGELGGRRWQLSGFMVRQDRDSGVTWHEYLLFNPYYGYRFLINDSGKWSLVTMLKDTMSAHGEVINFDGRRYEQSDNGTAEVIFVLGEFYWRVQVGETVNVKTFTGPAKTLFSETSAQETVWSLSEDIPASAAFSAFGQANPAAAERSAHPYFTATHPIEPTHGAFSHVLNDQLSASAEERQSDGGDKRATWPPSPQASTGSQNIFTYWFICLFILTALQFAHMFSASHKISFTGSYPFLTNEKSLKTITTPSFTLEKNLANLRLDFTAPVDNCWFYVSGELVNEQTGLAYPFEKTVEYYSGTDGGGAWTEGGQSANKLLSCIPGGSYHINMDVESGSSRLSDISNNFTVLAVRDVLTFANYFLCLFLISIIPIVIWLRSLDTPSWDKGSWQKAIGWLGIICIFLLLIWTAFNQ